MSSNLNVSGEVSTTHTTSHTVSDKLIKSGEGNTGTSHELKVKYLHEVCNTNVSNN